jgi:hypothetical protein
LRFVLNLGLMLAVALAVGFGLSWYALTDGRLFGAYQAGPWVSWTKAGAPDPDPYTRAYLARAGALQLGVAEGLQLVAVVDSDNRPLERTCTYRVDGRTPTATFWTLLPIGPDGATIARNDGPPGFHSGRLARATDGSLQLYVGPSPRPLNWLETTGEGTFTLVLSLYDTVFLTGIGANETQLPAIIREQC